VDYAGWQYQPGKRTIQGELQRAIGDLTGFFAKVSGASRTDAKVSALGQVANVVIDSPIPVQNLAKAINHRLPRDIVVTEAAEVHDGFDASGSARSKLYRYTIFTGSKLNVLEARHCWHLPGRLDVPAMNAAADLLLGTHDFKSFAAAADRRDNSVRTVTVCRVSERDKWLCIEVQANRFLYNMVRNIVGTLVQVGRGKCPPEKINQILAAKDRRTAGPIAPPEGLCLIKVEY
jgi:tRNA pseudouridine38-40 synthase